VGELLESAGPRVAIHALFSLVITWPLASWLPIGLPNGTEITGTVGFFNLWTLRWNQLQVGDLFRSYWDAPIFHPEPGTFALSEPQPLTGLVFTPISLVTGSPVVAYNLVLLLALTLNGLAAARLARRLGVAEVPAVLAGVLAQALPFVVVNELGVLQLAMVFPMLFLADAVLAWARPGSPEVTAATVEPDAESEVEAGREAEEPEPDEEAAPEPEPTARRAEWTRALAIGAWLSATFLTCGYYGLFTVLIVVPAALVLVRRDWIGPHRLAQLAAAVALFAVTSAPVLIPQARYTSAYSRPEAAILGNSAAPRAFLTLDSRLPGADLPWLIQERGERLYPGTVLLVLAVAGVVLVGLTSAGRRYRRDGVLFVGVVVVLGGLVSLGLRLSIFGWQPYQLVRSYVPGFDDLRSPFRAGVLAQAFLVPLAAVALDRTWTAFRRAPEQAGRVGRVACVALVVVGLAEVWPVSQPMVEVPSVGYGTDWVDWLAADQDPGAGDGSVAFVPFPANGSYVSYEDTTVWMLAGLDHGRPLVNGYSGLFPGRYDELEGAMRAGFPSGKTTDLLVGARVSWVVTSRVWAEGDGKGAMEVWSNFYRPVFTGKDTVIFQVVHAPRP
jgi:hypothetical protein